MQVTRWNRSWVRKAFLGAALGVGHFVSPLHAEERPLPMWVTPAGHQAENLAEPSPTAAALNAPDCCDPCAPAWCDPVSRVPNFFSDFLGRGLRVSQETAASQLLNFTGAGAEGFDGGFIIEAPLTVNGPGGPYTMNNDIPYNPGDPPLPENGEFTPLVQAQFPGATFVTGGQSGNQVKDFFYRYLFTTGQNVSVNLPNPAGGGLVGRNYYFDNGSALPRDRVYFFYNHVGSYQGLVTPFDINRYVFGAEKTFLDGLVSLELRLPFAGTANSDQVAGQALAVDDAEFGNVGLLLKGAIIRTPNFVACVGLGFSVPTADDSRLILGGVPVVAIENETCILQPLVGFAWAPNDRLYAQGGMQFDIDPSGNTVRALDANGGLSSIGVLNDQEYLLMSGAVGYWVYQNPCGCLTGAALQGELDYYSSLGDQDFVQAGSVTVADLGGNLDVFNATLGSILEFGERTNLALGVAFPVGGDDLYDWNLIVQLNYEFGGVR